MLFGFGIWLWRRDEIEQAIPHSGHRASTQKPCLTGWLTLPRLSLPVSPSTIGNRRHSPRFVRADRISLRLIIALSALDKLGPGGKPTVV
ncbi:hypothetical protein G8D25_00890 (plasmid) [Ralstonia solanacearum]|uniref:hypothetical protein n=1 Tax=Ralstonia solanacearum TaxID=305 RepID=UPI001448F7BC|nr:hypothetical protein [Ralstonia solanacearum]QJC22902.1 hypothetical protein G8D25_00890 [Ralstonia solanacearum]